MRKRPHQHYRSIKTRKGRRRILVNKGIKRRKKRRGWKYQKSTGMFVPDTTRQAESEQITTERLNRMLNNLNKIQQYIDERIAIDNLQRRTAELDKRR